MRKLIQLFSVAASLALTACAGNFPGPGPSDPSPIPPPTPPQSMSDTAQGNPEASGMGPDNQMVARNNVQASAPLGGNILRAMDSIDRQKLFHALDAPIGKSSHWVNALTDISYTVTPVSKASLPGNPYCRRYSMTAVRGAKTQSGAGIACVDQNGNWSEATG